MRKVRLVLAIIICLTAIHPIRAYEAVDYYEFLGLRKLIEVALRAKEIGFSDERLNDITLQNAQNRKIRVLNLIKMLEYGQSVLGYSNDVIQSLKIDSRTEEIDLLEMIKKLAIEEKPQIEATTRILNAADTIQKLKEVENKVLSDYREKILNPNYQIN